MICPRCSFPNRRGTLACARCGETAPRPVQRSFDSYAGPQGQRPAAPVTQEIPLSPKSGGVRALGGGPAMTPVGRMRPLSTPRWERNQPRSARRQMTLIPTGPSAPSVVHQAKTDPAWIVPPDETTDPAGPAEDVPMDDLNAESLKAPLGRRFLAGVIDSAVVLGAFTIAVVLGATAYGWHALMPQFNRGFDTAIDGLLIGHRLVLPLAVLLLALGASYATLAHALGGATLGKAFMGMRVVTQEGDEITWSTSLWRSLVSTISLALGGLGIASVIFDPHRVALHDHLVGTRLVMVPQEPAESDGEPV